MKFLLLSRHTGSQEIPLQDREKNVQDMMQWFGLLKASTAMPINGGRSITSETTEDYQGVVKVMLVFEADSIEQAVALARQSPGLKYGWTHDVLPEMPLNYLVNE